MKLVYGAMVDANPTDKVIQLKSLETHYQMLQMVKQIVFIPFEATKPLAEGLGAMTEMLKDGKSRNTNNENTNK